MTTQNYLNHKKLKPETPSHKLYYLFVIPFFFLTLANLCRALYFANGRITAVFFVLTSFSFILAYLLFRSFALRAQDRGIRTEENFRHYLLTGKQLDKALTISQIIALRFAPDEEFVDLAKRAAIENLSNNDIKKAIKNWKEDNYRV